eukprot:scaffold182978_cov34-Cyclotella_meneghiniana.AAC.2
MGIPSAVDKCEISRDITCNVKSRTSCSDPSIGFQQCSSHRGKATNQFIPRTIDSGKQADDNSSSNV